MLVNLGLVGIVTVKSYYITVPILIDEIGSVDTCQVRIDEHFVILAMDKWSFDVRYIVTQIVGVKSYHLFIIS